MSKFKVNASKTSQNNFVTDQWKKILSSIASTRQPTLTRKILKPFCPFVTVVPLCAVHEAIITIPPIGLQECTRWSFSRFLPIFSAKMKNDEQPIRDSVP